MPTTNQDAGAIDWAVFDECLSIAGQNDPSSGPAMRWAWALRCFQQSTGRQPRFDLRDAWENCRPGFIQVHPAGPSSSPRPAAIAQGVA